MRVVIVSLLAVFILVSFTAFAVEAKVNFSGQWILNTEKSQFGEGRRWAAKELVITQEGNNLLVKRTLQGRDGGDFEVTEKYTLDGKEIENTMFNTPRKSTVNWSADGMNLTSIRRGFTWSIADWQTSLRMKRIWRKGPGSHWNLPLFRISNRPVS